MPLLTQHQEGHLHTDEVMFVGSFCVEDRNFSGATGVPHLQLLFVLIGRGVFGSLIVIDPEAEDFSVFPVDADTVFSNVRSINPHTITLLLRKIFI